MRGIVEVLIRLKVSKILTKDWIRCPQALYIQ